MMYKGADTGKPLLLIFPFEQLAHYLRCLLLARHLAPYFEIRVAYSRSYANFVAQEGFETFACPGMDMDTVLACVKRFDFSWLHKRSLDQAYQHQVAAIEKWKPVVVLGDAVPTLKMAAEKTGVPYVALMNGYMTKYYAGVRHMSWRFPLYKYFRYLPGPLLDQLTKWGEQQSFRDIHKPFQNLRQQYGLSKKSLYPDELEGDLNFICDLPELFPQKPLPSNYQFIPPLLYEAGSESHIAEPPLDKTKQTIFVSMGSTGDWQQVRFLNEPLFQQYHLITAGDQAGVVQGAHVTPLPFANLQQLLPKVDLALCHGGNGTVYQALQAGLPVLCKTAHFEQEWNVRAVERLQLGASLDGLKSSVDHLAVIKAWMGQKARKPLRTVQQRLTNAFHFEPVATRVLRLLPTTKTVYKKVQNSAPDPSSL